VALPAAIDEEDLSALRLQGAAPCGTSLPCKRDGKTSGGTALEEISSVHDVCHIFFPYLL
jgi:hypothetical protein